MDIFVKVGKNNIINLENFRCISAENKTIKIGYIDNDYLSVELETEKEAIECIDKFAKLFSQILAKNLNS